jgi:hemerythrin
MHMQHVLPVDRSHPVHVEADRQRQSVAKALHQLEGSCETSASTGGMRGALDELTQHARASFEYQEAAWEHGGGLQRGWHRDAHRFMLEYLDRLREDMDQIDKAIVQLRLCFIKQWLTTHFRSEDFNPV